MKKIIVFLLILLVLIGIFFIVIGINTPKDDEGSEAGTGDIQENQDNEITGGVVKEDSKNNQAEISGNAVSGEGGGLGSSGGTSSESSIDSETTFNQELPADLYTKPCSYYFLEYGVCAGVCPDGQCLVDGKSCYCRDV